MSIQIKGATAPGYLADVNSDNELVTTLTPNTENAGYVIATGEKGINPITGEAINIAAEMTEDFAQRVAIETVQFSEVFQQSLTTPFINYGKWNYTTSTHTAIVADGFCVLNTGNSVATGHTVMQSKAVFPLYGKVLTTYFQFRARIVGGDVREKNFEIGMGLCAAATVPTDGAFFRWTPNGEYRCIVVNNSQESYVEIPLSLRPSDLVTHFFLIEYTSGKVVFWIDDVVVGIVNAQPTLDSPIRTCSVPVFFRQSISAIGASAITRIEVAEVHVTQSGCAMFKDVNVMCSAMGQNFIQGQTTFVAANGGTGTLTNYVNAAGPTNCTAFSNTALPTGPANHNLPGGQFLMNAPATNDAEDKMLFAWQNPPIASPDIRGYTVFLNKIRIDTVNIGAAVATTPTIFQWAVAVGSSTLTLATVADAAAGVKQPRRQIVGMQSWVVGAAIGTMGQTIDTDFPSPLVVNPGEYIHVILKVVLGTATGSQQLRGIVQFNGFFE